MLVTLKEYSIRIGVCTATVRQKILRGKLEAIKRNGLWFIDDCTPYEDFRFSYRNRRDNIGVKNI